MMMRGWGQNGSSRELCGKNWLGLLFHFKCPNFRNWKSFLHKWIIFQIDETNVLSWRVCERGVAQLQAMHQGRLGTDAQSKGYYTKTGDGRNQMDSRSLDQLFTGNHSDDARGSYSCVFTDFQEMFWETIR